MALLQTSWQVAQAAGEPHATIRVKNLQASAKVGTDAWGTPSNNKIQPVLISASVSLQQPFSTASESDTVTNSTVHYGILSKAILAGVKTFEVKDGGATDGSDLKALLDCVWRYLTGSVLENGSLVDADDGVGVGAGAGAGVEKESKTTPLLDVAMVKALEIQILLPKASLIGNGVSLTGASVFQTSDKAGLPVSSYSLKLRLHDLRIQTLIGVNPNERLAKQIVVANIEVDKWILSRENTDAYAELEEIVVKTIEESSFQTLEALASHLGRRIIRFFLLPRSAHPEQYHVKITLEKPTAVTWADAPAVEMLLSSDKDSSQGSVVQKEETGKFMPPFPLQGRLGDWIKENCGADSS